jgi:hypothetical protein
MSADGSDAPSRKEKAEEVWSSMYMTERRHSVEHSLDLPSPRRTMTGEAVEGPVGELDVPLVAIPGSGAIVRI